MLNKYLLVMLLLLLAAMPAAAQDAIPWSVDLLNSSTQEFVRISVDGSQTNIPLGLEPNTFLSGTDMAFTSDGSRAAYCTFYQDPSQGGTVVVMRDLINQTTLWTLPLGNPFGCLVSRFNTDDSLLALGIVNHMVDDPAAPPNIPPWELRLVDASTGAVVNGLDISQVVVPDDFFRGMYTPRVHEFTADYAVFMLIPWGTEGIGNMPSYIWRMNEGLVEPIPNWGHFSLDFNPAGELIWLDYDESLPVGTPGGMMALTNVLRLADKTGETRTIYHSPDWLPFDAHFVNSGREILISMVGSFNPDTPDVQPGVRLILLDRAGAVREVGMYGSFVMTAPAPDGFVVLSSEVTDGTTPPPIHLDYVNAEGTRRLWSVISDNMGISWTIARSGPAQWVADLPSFPTAG
ncbi:MAG: hypothetical protein SF123_14420 [Chloroflexota bacterium]|nr:hypothetical protein [Chloroflexota bacterium]